MIRESRGRRLTRECELSATCHRVVRKHMLAHHRIRAWRYPVSGRGYNMATPQSKNHDHVCRHGTHSILYSVRKG